MTTGEIWWSRLVNSVRFITEVKEVIMNGRSVIMNFSDKVPWIESMTYELEQQLAFLTDTRSFEVHDASKIKTNPGTYLFERFCSDSERKKYWPVKHHSHEKFLAVNDNTALNHRIICVTGLSSRNTSAWLKTVTEYLENTDSNDRGIFILVTQDTVTHESRLIGNIKYTDYITAYDYNMLCLTLLSAGSCRGYQKKYISEIAVNLAGNDVEKAAMLVSSGIRLALNPIETVNRLYNSRGVSEPELKEKVTVAVWKAQINLLFPLLEESRRELCNKYKKDIQKFLPLISSFGERIDKASEVEIGQLFFICVQNKILGSYDFERLKKMRDARNLLAHREIVEYENLSKLVAG